MRVRVRARVTVWRPAAREVLDPSEEVSEKDLDTVGVDVGAVAEDLRAQHGELGQGLRFAEGEGEGEREGKGEDEGEA